MLSIKTATAKAMQNRDVAKQIFLDEAGWGTAKRDLLAGDASFRSYDRVEHNGSHAVLMDAPPPAEDVRPFVRMTYFLRDAGYSAPKILAKDEENGFLLLEDLGDASYTKLLQAQPQMEMELYNAAIDWLADLHMQGYDLAPHDLPPYNEQAYLREVALFSDWFLPQIHGVEKAKELREEWLSLWRSVLTRANVGTSLPVHRDYHADNLLWLPEREGIKRVGVLDYQDALMGDAAYDMVSLLEDARRDVGEEVVLASISRYLQATGQNVEHFYTNFAILGAQRNAKIIGIFTRLCVRDGKPQYLSYLDRVWKHYLNNVQHPSLQAVSEWMDEYVPLKYRGVFVANTAIGAIE